MIKKNEREEERKVKEKGIPYKRIQKWK